MLLVVAILLAIFVLDEPWTWIVVLAGATCELAEATLSSAGRSGAGRSSGPRRWSDSARSSPPSAGPSARCGSSGELWQARCEPGADVGDEVIVRALDGLTLVVEPL